MAAVIATLEKRGGRRKKKRMKPETVFEGAETRTREWRRRRTREKSPDTLGRCRRAQTPVFVYFYVGMGRKYVQREDQRTQTQKLLM